MEYIQGANVQRLMAGKHRWLRASEDPLDERATRFLTSSPPVEWWGSVTFDLEVADDFRDTCMRTSRGVVPANAVMQTLPIFFENGNSPGIDYRNLQGILGEGPRSVGVLKAHGTMDDGWVYQDLEKTKGLIQNWIRRNSERHDALIICSCNPGEVMPAYEGVPIVYARGNIGLRDYYETHIVTSED